MEKRLTNLLWFMFSAIMTQLSVDKSYFALCVFLFLTIYCGVKVINNKLTKNYKDENN